MRKELQQVLEGYLDRFSHILVQVRRSRNSGPSIDTQHVVGLTEEELRDFTTGPAGGAKPMKFSSGENPSSMGPGEGGGSSAGAAAAGAERAEGTEGQGTRP